MTVKRPANEVDARRAYLTVHGWKVVNDAKGATWTKPGTLEDEWPELDAVRLEQELGLQMATGVWP